MVIWRHITHTTRKVVRFPGRSPIKAKTPDTAAGQFFGLLQIAFAKPKARKNNTSRFHKTLLIKAQTAPEPPRSGKGPLTRRPTESGPA